MASTLKDTLTGTHGHATADADDIESVVHRVILCDVDIAAGGDQTICAHKAQSGMILVSAGLLPSQDATANGTNYVTLGIAKGDAAAGSLTSFDTYTTASTGLTKQTLRAFTIAPDDSDTLAKDDYLYVTAAASGSGVAVKAKLVLEYKLSN